MSTGIYAVIRIKGCVKTGPKTEKTLEMMGLNRDNSCTLVPMNPTYEGMLKRAATHVTWGEVSGDVLEKMLDKRGRTTGGRRLDSKAARAGAEKIAKARSLRGLDIRPVFGLSPPSGGLRSVKLLYPRGDAGPRGDAINKLLLRMI